MAIPFPHKGLLNFVEAKHKDQQEHLKNYSCLTPSVHTSAQSTLLKGVCPESRQGQGVEDTCFTSKEEDCFDCLQFTVEKSKHRKNQNKPFFQRN